MSNICHEIMSLVGSASLDSTNRIECKRYICVAHLKCQVSDSRCPSLSRVFCDVFRRFGKNYDYLWLYYYSFASKWDIILEKHTIFATHAWNCSQHTIYINSNQTQIYAEFQRLFWLAPLTAASSCLWDTVQSTLMCLAQSHTRIPAAQTRTAQCVSKRN